MRNKLIVLGLGVVAAILGPTGAIAGPESPLISPGVVCNGCHGPGGNSQGNAVPSLAGQPETYFLAAMEAYRSGKRTTTVMGGIGKGYSPAMLKQMGTYYAHQRALPNREPLDPDLVKQGSKVFYQRCNTCHLDGKLWSSVHANRAYEANCSPQCHLDYGSDSKIPTPFIGGQRAAYMENELRDFVAGNRPMSPRKTLALKNLTDKEIRAVAAFYASQLQTPQ